MDVTLTDTEQANPTILVVEDNPVERQLVGKILRNANFEVIAVDCGEVVLDTVLNYQPDLILLDALLPDIDGFDVCVTLRNHPKGSFIPIVMLTGLDDVGSINRAYEAGATDFFTKPINHSLLIHRVRYLLRARLIMDELRFSRQSLSSAQALAKMGHWELNLDTNKYTISDEIYSLYGIDADTDLNVGGELFGRCHPDDKQWVKEAAQKAIANREEIDLEHRILLEDGEERYIKVQMRTIEDESDISDRVLGISMDITELKKSEKETLYLAYFDQLTDLPSRFLLERFISRSIPHAHASGQAVGLLAVDMDLFNRINNSMGHSAGDAILQQLTQRLKTLVDCPPSTQMLECLAVGTVFSGPAGKNMVGRLAADTFIVVLRSVDRQSGEAEKLAEKIQDTFKEPFTYRGQELFVSACIGIAFSESGSALAETVLQQADLALHEAKSEGWNEIKEYSGDLVAKVSSHLSIQTDLRKALEGKEFQLYYQPKINISDGKVHGFEALIRWIHPIRGLIPPDQFITIAEETGQIVEIGNWVLKTACQQMKDWLDEGIVDASMAVNVSARQFKELDIVETVQAILDDIGLPSSRLQLEITEGILISNPAAEDLVRQLQELGISIALDDFGTGFSSLSYITRFPIDTIKIDRCFIQDITAESEKAAIVTAVTNLSHSLGFTVVAEGVETFDELDVIRQLHCDEVQGYLHCRPIPAGQMREWLNNHQSSPPLTRKNLHSAN